MKSARFIIVCVVVGMLGLMAFAQSGRRPVYPPPTSSSSPQQPTATNPNAPCPKGLFPGEYEGLSPETRPTTAQSSSPSSDPNAEEVLKIDTTLVMIPVTVFDRSGRFVPYLTKCDFHLYENGVRQEVTEFSTVSAPFHVVLLLDTSNSTAFKIEEIQSAALAFVNQLRTDDKVMVVSFDDDIHIECEFTNDRYTLRRAIYQIRTRGNTKLYDAVDFAVAERLNNIQGRKAIVLFTDGVDTKSKHANARSTVELVEESDVLVYPIQYDTYIDMGNGGYGRGNPPIIVPPPDIWGRRRRWPFASPLTMLTAPQFGRNQGGVYGTPQQQQDATIYLETLAKRSGGRHQRAEGIQNLNQAFSLIAEELRHQYALGYYPTNAAKDGTYRSVKVRVSQPSWVIRAKEGYRAGGSAAANPQRPTMRRRNFDPQ
jgi:VWFA-related protein